MKFNRKNGQGQGNGLLNWVYQLRTFFARKSIKKLVKKIEYYQPLYNFIPLNNAMALRPCLDRAEIIAHHLNPLKDGNRLLDIGCSLGFFSYYFAERNFKVTGIDNSKKNIRICRLLQRFNVKKIDFFHKTFSHQSIQEIPEHEFDIIFILSVLHHLIHSKGLLYVQQMMATLIDKIPVLFVELALHSEQTTAPWKHSLPPDELAIFALCPPLNIEKIGECSNHLSATPRPLYKIQKNALKFAGHTYPIQHAQFHSFSGSQYVGRSYYWLENFFVKRYLISSAFKKANLPQILREINNYHTLPNDLPCFPKLIATQQHPNAIELMLTKIPGITVYDLLRQGTRISGFEIFSGLIKALQHLFQYGLYHNDIRLWNVIVNPQGIYLIDLALAEREETEKTTIALQWFIVHLYQSSSKDIPYPLTLPPDRIPATLPSPFYLILQTLQDSSNFQDFLAWWNMTAFNLEKT